MPSTSPAAPSPGSRPAIPSTPGPGDRHLGADVARSRSTPLGRHRRRPRRARRRAGRRARDRPRHRVPPRADLLAAGLGGADSAGRVASPSSTPSPSTLALLGRLLGPDHVVVMHAATQDLEVLRPPLRHGPRGPVRHPGGRRLPRLRHAVAGVAGAGRARHRPAEGRPAHRLAAPPAGRRRPHLRRRRRRPPRCRWPTASARALQPGVGCRGPTTSASGSGPRPPSPVEPDEAWWRVKDARSLRGTAVGRRPGAWRAWRERRAGEVDQPIRFVLPDLALVGIAQKPPGRRAGAAPGAWASTTDTCATAPPQGILDAVRDRPGAAEGRATASRPPATSTASCARPSPSCRRGSASSAATSASTPRCSPPGATSRRSCATTRRPAGRRVAGRGARRRHRAPWSAATPPSPSTAAGGLVLEERSGRAFVLSDGAATADS